MLAWIRLSYCLFWKRSCKSSEFVTIRLSGMSDSGQEANKSSKQVILCSGISALPGLHARSSSMRGRPPWLESEFMSG